MITITLSKAKTPMYFHAAGFSAAPAKADLLTFITVISMGKMMGKLRIAISPKLLLERDEMADTMVSSEAKPKEPNTNAERYSG